ncbi:MAG: NAD-dependent epimerase/dehydratase family protein [Anaerolineaceae bacterium]|nr:NAD-dependent epimerase/dehydratase family protein [Anaerolineaceae bacterium]
MPNVFAEKTILITGGAGFVGSNLVRSLLGLDAGDIHVVDNLLSSERANLPADPRVHFTKDSIASDQVLNHLQDEYDFIFHLSTYHGNQSSMHNPLADHENNLLTTLKLLERVKSFKHLKKLVYSGAGCAVAEKTYDDAQATLEDAPISVNFDSPYSISKIVGEFYLVYYHNQHGVPAVRARFQNVYGPGEILGAGEWRGTPATVWRNVTPTFIYKALKGEPLPLEGEGLTSRDFIFVEDIVRGLLACAENGAPGDAYNLASGIETSIRQLADTINELTGNPAPLRLLPRRTWDHSGRRFGSTKKSKEKLGFAAQVSLRQGLERTVDWTRQNLKLIESCIQKHASHMPPA